MEAPRVCTVNNRIDEDQLSQRFAIFPFVGVDGEESPFIKVRRTFLLIGAPTVR